MTAHIAKFEEEWEIEDDDAEREKNRRPKRCKLNLSTANLLLVSKKLSLRSFSTLVARHGGC